MIIVPPARGGDGDGVVDVVVLGVDDVVVVLVVGAAAVEPLRSCLSKLVLIFWCTAHIVVVILLFLRFVFLARRRIGVRSTVRTKFKHSTLSVDYKVELESHRVALDSDDLLLVPPLPILTAASMTVTSSSFPPRTSPKPLARAFTANGERNSWKILENMYIVKYLFKQNTK